MLRIGNVYVRGADVRTVDGERRVAQGYSINESWPFGEGQHASDIVKAVEEDERRNGGAMLAARIAEPLKGA